MLRIKYFLCTTLALLVTQISGCSTVHLGEQWVTGPLKEQRYKGNGEALDQKQFANMLLASDVIFLGEKHDNSQHQAHQTEVVQLLLDNGKKPAIGLEMIYAEQTSATLNYINLPKGDDQRVDADQWLKKSLGWEGRKEYNWNRYGKTIKLARANGLPLFGIDLPDTLRSRITKVGLSKLNPVEKLQLSPVQQEENDQHDNEAYRQLMYKIFKSAHCGWGMESHLRKLYDNWNARNDKMAEVINLMASKRENRPVVVVGAGHLRYGRGVMESLTKLNPNLKQVSVAFTEIEAGLNSPTEYSKPLSFMDTDFGFPYDLLWFTEGTPPGPDLCKQYLSRKKKTKK